MQWCWWQQCLPAYDYSRFVESLNAGSMPSGEWAKTVKTVFFEKEGKLGNARKQHASERRQNMKEISCRRLHLAYTLAKNDSLYSIVWFTDTIILFESSIWKAKERANCAVKHACFLVWSFLACDVCSLPTFSILTTESYAHRWSIWGNVHIVTSMFKLTSSFKYEHNHQERMYNRVSFPLQLSHTTRTRTTFCMMRKEDHFILWSAGFLPLQFTWLCALSLLLSFHVTLNWKYRIFAWMGKRLNGGKSSFLGEGWKPNFVIFAIMMIVLLDICPFCSSLLLLPIVLSF